ncbi:hypothetical protein IFM89_023409 [Coptis chinensis]|uniref:Uncharacterized protein n=1 Tax=Coptis chinensis TaxID=261450 RepID=A0A835HXG3_9MAGN|nr:hypothetical protein IFM89_023409 [Coptis chinensis]
MLEGFSGGPIMFPLYDGCSEFYIETVDGANVVEAVEDLVPTRNAGLFFFYLSADVQDELGHQVVESIGAEKASYRHCDVRDEKQVEEIVAYTLDKYGGLDIMFSNAGVIGAIHGILELDMEAFDNTMAINVRGVAVTMKYAVRAMVAKQIRGWIICTASVAACIGGSGPHAYTTLKHVVVGLVQSVCSELGEYGIRVNSISPFGVATPLACCLEVEQFP